MIEGLILMTVALAITIVTPASRQIDARKSLRPPVAAVLVRVYPVPLPDPPSLEFLVTQAEVALERDAVARGLRTPPGSAARH